MYWLGYLTDGAAAGELDWKAIGGTWGVATSRGDRWRPPQNGAALPLPTTLARTCAAIEKKSAGQARYVERYFYDIAAHLKSLSSVVVPGGAVHYVVGNSKYYDTIVPVEEWYGELLAAANFHSVTVRALRKRSSKKELYEFLVSAVRDDERA